MKQVVNFSGGAGSWAAGKRLAEQLGVEDMVLVFCDTKMEDPDLYRFLHEAAANIGAPLVILADGRNVWELFADRHTIGNGKVDLCSSVLKRDLLDKWRNANCSPEHTTINIGIDWTESHRLERAQKASGVWKYAAPLCDAPYLTKADVLAWLKREGIEPPRLYAMGFPHNNCGGFCVKAGQAQFRLLLEKFPERYAWHEAQEERVREIQRQHGIVPSSVLYHRRGGKGRVRVTLKEFREAIEQDRTNCDEYDWGGCGCALETSDEGRYAGI